MEVTVDGNDRWKIVLKKGDVIHDAEDLAQAIWDANLAQESMQAIEIIESEEYLQELAENQG